MGWIAIEKGKGPTSAAARWSMGRLSVLCKTTIKHVADNMKVSNALKTFEVIL
ncbi:11229_t:CDS:1 [Paraglomus brasilianum]|uniref:11229_t:CDS:1 n=1 Tax=Paraglomus brasilianum TaxID=144538 RepID=A0A9N9CXR4_9GLOM|nr:11229_t:CDS:1 [Paraglomus brasilianum]